MKKYLLISTLFLVTFLVGCSDDFLENTPEGTVTQEQLALNPTATQSTLDGIYANLRTYGIGGTTRHVDYGHKGITAGLDMMANDVTQSFFHWYGFYNNYDAREQTASRTLIIWQTYYSQIFQANSIINSIDPAEEDPAVKAILGQALALRAFCYHNLVRIYGKPFIGNEGAAGVPINDGSAIEGQARASVGEVYNFIRADLEQAVNLLADYSTPVNTDVDLSVAQGLLADVYLNMGEWALAAQMANSARSAKSLMPSEEYLAGFSNINGTEWMWGADIDAESSTVFASFFSHFDNPNAGYAGALGVYKNIDARLYDMIPETDIRKQAFIDPVEGHPDYPGLPGYANIKFLDPSFFEGDYVYMRAAEMYLIEAEAKARSGDGSAADVLFEFVSSRDPNYVKSTNTGDALVEEIYLQRRIELWAEGFSFFDMKRLNKPLDRTYDGSNHPSFAAFNLPAGADEFQFQIPEDELNANDNITDGDQNP